MLGLIPTRHKFEEGSESVFEVHQFFWDEGGSSSRKTHVDCEAGFYPSRQSNGILNGLEYGTNG